MDLILKRVVNVKTVVTQRWKDETQQAMQGQINEVDSQLQQLEMQGQRAIAEVKQQALQPPGPQVMQQIESIQMQVNEQKSQFLEQKNGVLQQLQQVQFLELNQEVGITQIDGNFAVQVGDSLIEKMNLEILLRDGIVMEIRGIV